ncbi:hypothetical protein [Leptospira perolatii]|nr:hypothetical protein [Leptospira perolatii]
MTDRIKRSKDSGLKRFFVGAWNLLPHGLRRSLVATSNFTGLDF